MEEFDSLSYQLGPYQYREATSPEEIEAVHRLNYRTFVEEIPQHPTSAEGRLVDKFDHKNRYVLAIREGAVVGMIAFHDRAPFSAAEKLARPELLEAFSDSCLEVRLLAIERRSRFGPVFAGLCYVVFRYAQTGGYRHLLISALQERLSLYERLGFRELGPPVREGDSRFVPMLMSLESVPAAIVQDVARWRRRLESRTEASGTTDASPPDPMP